MTPLPEEISRPTRPRVIYATIYPPDPEGRAETLVTRELLRGYVAAEREFDLSVVIFCKEVLP